MAFPHRFDASNLHRGRWANFYLGILREDERIPADHLPGLLGSVLAVHSLLVRLFRNQVRRLFRHPGLRDCRGLQTETVSKSVQVKACSHQTKVGAKAKNIKEEAKKIKEQESIPVGCLPTAL